MKYLKIENGKGHFFKEVTGLASQWTEIDQISRDDLFFLLNKAISDDFEMDPFDEALLLNKAHQIIYKNLYEKFMDLLGKKTRFKDESESIYKVALDKYSL